MEENGLVTMALSMDSKDLVLICGSDSLPTQSTANGEDTEQKLNAKDDRGGQEFQAALVC